MSTELERLERGPDPQESPGGLGTVRFIAKCSRNATEVLATAKKVLEVAIQLSDAGVFEESAWATALSDRFVKNCGSTPSLEELHQELALPLEERVRISRESKWSVGMFMNSFLPAEPYRRYWSWWDAAILDESHLAV